MLSLLFPTTINHCKGNEQLIILFIRLHVYFESVYHITTNENLHIDSLQCLINCVQIQFLATTDKNLTYIV